MSTPDERIRVFKDTLAWIDEDRDLSASIPIAKKNTKVYYEDDYPAFDASKTRETVVTVTGNRSYEAAMKLHGEYMADNENRLEELKRQYGGDPRDAYWDYHTEAEQYAAAQLGLSSEEVFKAANALSDAGYRG